MSGKEHSLRLTGNQLGKRFGRRILFRNLDLNLEGGQVLAVTGKNGSGKSTLMRILAGVMKPTKGTVQLHLHDHFVDPEKHTKYVGMVAPYLNVYEGFTARENLSFIATVRRIAQPQKHIEEILDTVGLLHRADDQVHTFSSGMIQRVRLAAAICTDPPLLLLDEPTATLDEAGIAIVHHIVNAQKKAGKLVVLATNNPEEAAICDQQLRVEYKQ